MTGKNNIINLAVNEKTGNNTTEKTRRKFLELRVIEAGPSSEITEFDVGTEILMERAEVPSPCVYCVKPGKEYSRCNDCGYNSKE